MSQLSGNPMLSQKEILIVDDSPDNLRLLSRILTEQGYNIHKALDGKMALRCCKKTLPDLILLDIRMPDLNGYEVCRQLKADQTTCDIPVIFLSALNDIFDKITAFNVGGVDYITKPFQDKEVLARVQNQLMLKEAKEQVIKLNEELEIRVQERTKTLEKLNQELQQEIAERQQLQNQLLYLAQHDFLTNLPNRALFLERLQTAIHCSKQQENYQFAMLFLDCDRFKVVNDSFGHLVGDELLCALARRLETALDPIALIARFGGDEFAILSEPITEISEAINIAQIILKTLSEPFQLSRCQLFMNASIGIAVSQRGYEKPEDVLRDADAAMYCAKDLGKGRYLLFEPVMHEKAVRFIQIENDLRQAIKQEELKVYYQPIVCLNTGKISGFEALIRWQHPTFGMISPGTFIPIAEETGLITEIDIWVLLEACRQLSEWQATGTACSSLSMSVNLSSRLFSQQNLLESVDEILDKTQINPLNLKLEITETAMMEDQKNAQTILHQLKSRKIQLSIDDFGTGYSSLSYLHSFPLNILKIDQSFVQRMENFRSDKGLVPMMIDIAHAMEMNAIAEGIETHEQLAKLRELNCDFGQGYLFAKPLNCQLAAELLEAKPQW